MYIHIRPAELLENNIVGNNVSLHGVPWKGFNFTFSKLHCFEQQAGQFMN